MRSFVRFWAMLAIPWVAAGASCGSSADDRGNVTGSDVPGRAWHCSAFGDSCTCSAYKENDGDIVFGSPNPVPRCDDGGCCLLTSPPGAPYDAECECIVSDACEAEAASRRNTVVSATCPPEAEQEPVQCAAQGENCRTEYLRDNDLEGCCDDMICKTIDGVPTCQPATEQERAWFDACESAADTFDQSLVVLDVLTTSAGPLTLTTRAYGNEVELGMDGCVRSVTIGLGDPACGLTVTAGPGRDASGALVVGEARLDTELCDGFPLLARVPLTGTVLAQGIACETGLSSAEYCHAGTFEIRLSGSAPGTITPDQTLSVEGALLRVEGALCDVQMTTMACD